MKPRSGRTWGAWYFCPKSYLNQKYHIVHVFQANSLYKCVLSAELQGVEYVEDVIRELEKEIEAVQQATKGNHKVAKVSYH